MKLEELSAFEIGSLVNERKISPVEVVEYFLDRIEKRNESVNAFVYVKADYALEKARELESRLKRGEWGGPFAGVPFALKDFLPNKKGWQSSHGGVECLVSTDDCDSVFCTAMEKAGGIAIGKTNAPAYGFRGTTDNLMYGPTSTPFNTKCNSGGSSGGSAAAVADGLVPIAEGGDAGGSIRIPACFCNLYGFKAGEGTVPSVCRPDAWSATHPLCFNGGLTKTVTDSAILMDYMGYEDKRDPFSLPKTCDFYKELENLPQNLKIAFTEDFGLFEVEEEVRSSVREAAMKFCELGFSVRNTKGPDFVNGKRVEPLIGWTQTFLANFTGNPAASIPASLSKNGVPIGMQIVAPRHNDLLLFQASRAYEKMFPWQELYKRAWNRPFRA